MIKVKNNKTGKETIIPAKRYFESDINLAECEIIEWKDVVHVYTDSENRISLGIMSRLEAKKYLDSGTNYYVENVPRPDLNTVPPTRPVQANIPVIQERNNPGFIKSITLFEWNILGFIKSITVFEWAVIGGLLALIIALWTIF